jgi:hypothetical protein
MKIKWQMVYAPHGTWVDEKGIVVQDGPIGNFRARVGDRRILVVMGSWCASPSEGEPSALGFKPIYLDEITLVPVNIGDQFIEGWEKEPKSNPDRYTLMYLEPQAEPVYILHKHSQYDHEYGGLERLEGEMFHFNSNTCAVNWLRSSVDLMQGNDRDCHGLFRVAAVFGDGEVPFKSEMGKETTEPDHLGMLRAYQRDVKNIKELFASMEGDGRRFGPHTQKTVEEVKRRWFEIIGTYRGAMALADYFFKEQPILQVDIEEDLVSLNFGYTPDDAFVFTVNEVQRKLMVDFVSNNVLEACRY